MEIKCNDQIQTIPVTCMEKMDPTRFITIDPQGELELEEEEEDLEPIPYYNLKIDNEEFQIKDRKYSVAFMEYCETKYRTRDGTTNGQGPGQCLYEKNKTKITIEENKEVPIGELEQKQIESLTKILDKNKNLFARSMKELQQTHLGEHTIIIENVHPIKKNAYRAAPKENEFIEKEINEILKQDHPLSLNDITKKDNYPLPRIDEILDSLNRAQWFTTLDLASGYWQIKVKAEDQEKTAFITKFGTYEFKVIPFGLCNAPATFQRTMDRVLGNLKGKFVMVYLDDAEKCYFGAKELQFLGHVVGEEGIKPDPEKINKIVNYPIPANIRDLKDFEKPFLLYTDASLIGIGAVLAQKDGKDEYVVAYASRTLAPAEKNYAITELKCLAIIWAVKYFRHYLFGIHFTIITDHSALKWLLNSSFEIANRRLERWKITLSEYDYEIQYRKGTKHFNADALSQINPNTDLQHIPNNQQNINYE
ncbi:retroviral-like aspartic protease 1 [Rhizophagus clarus]|uniref:Retroviral-like aspartic protease 1 n=2 Tax=Rhizophagus clarus TaxID=94130 RepID=A0A8H3LHR0_9GLOM|nr:retroviral-like aspartic protease 1 [Rhizophagus clarus]